VCVKCVQAYLWCVYVFVLLVCTYLFIHILHVHSIDCARVCVCVRARVCLCVCAGERVCARVFIYVCVYLCVYLHAMSVRYRNTSRKVCIHS